jgi:hypothetical protein
MVVGLVGVGVGEDGEVMGSERVRGSGCAAIYWGGEWLPLPSWNSKFGGILIRNQ